MKCFVFFLVFYKMSTCALEFVRACARARSCANARKHARTSTIHHHMFLLLPHAFLLYSRHTHTSTLSRRALSASTMRATSPLAVATAPGPLAPAPSATSRARPPSAATDGSWTRAWRQRATRASRGRRHTRPWLASSSPAAATRRCARWCRLAAPVNVGRSW